MRRAVPVSIALVCVLLVVEILRAKPGDGYRIERLYYRVNPPKRFTYKAYFTPELEVPDQAVIISKAPAPDRDAYSGFEGTGLAGHLRAVGVTDVVVVGLATDYCVKSTALDAAKEGFGVTVVTDGIRAVNVEAGDGEVLLTASVDMTLVEEVRQTIPIFADRRPKLY